MMQSPMTTHGGSKEGQDRLVTKLLGGRCFLDIGCSKGIVNNNTFLLEKAGWRGWLFDTKAEAINDCRQTRSSPAYQVDVRTFDFKTFLREQMAPKVIDYISFDVDSSTVGAVRNFPFEDYGFLVMTIEHDMYRAPAPKVVEAKVAIASRLEALGGYRVLVENVECTPGKPFEDWIVNERYFPQEILNQTGANILWSSYLEKLEIRSPASDIVDLGTLPDASDGGKGEGRRSHAC